MKLPFKAICLILSCLLFFLAGAGELFFRGTDPAWPWGSRIMAWGLFFFVLSFLVTD